MMKMYGLDELLAFYLRRYPIEPDDEDVGAEWAEGIDITLAKEIAKQAILAVLSFLATVTNL